MIASRSVNIVRHPRGRYIFVPIAVSGVATPENKVTHWRRHKRCRSPSYERFLEKCSAPFMRLAEHLTALRAWCKQCLPDWRKPDVLRPGMVGMRGSTAIRRRACAQTEYTPPLPPRPLRWLWSRAPLSYLALRPKQKVLYTRKQRSSIHTAPMLWYIHFALPPASNDGKKRTHVEQMY